jgi:hypothetical protein
MATETEAIHRKTDPGSVRDTVTDVRTEADSLGEVAVPPTSSVALKPNARSSISASAKI